MVASGTIVRIRGVEVIMEIAHSATVGAAKSRNQIQRWAALIFSSSSRANFNSMVAMFGCVVGVAVVGATSPVYPLFVIHTLRVDALTSYILAAIAILMALPLFPVIGRLSDKIGRKPVIVADCMLAAISYFPLVKLHLETGPAFFPRSLPEVNPIVESRLVRVQTETFAEALLLFNA